MIFGADYKEYNYCYSTDDVTKYTNEVGEQYAIVEFSSVYIPGDERSRTNPGHGYPGRSEAVSHFIVFKNKDAWEREIQHRMSKDNRFSSREWVPITFRRPTITTTINVEIKE